MICPQCKEQEKTSVVECIGQSLTPSADYLWFTPTGEERQEYALCGLFRCEHGHEFFGRHSSEGWFNLDKEPEQIPLNQMSLKDALNSLAGHQ